MSERAWTIYLSGEIHSDWRERIADGVRAAGLPVEITAPVTDHSASDAAWKTTWGPASAGRSATASPSAAASGTPQDTLGGETDAFWRDHKGAGVNAIRTQTLIRRADVVVVRFGDRYREWNAAFDAGFAAALGKPVVTLHDGDLDHALKEVDRAALGVARTASQVVDVLRYDIAGELPARV